MDVLVRPIADGDVPAAVAIIRGGSLFPEAEDIRDTETYWGAVLETRRRGGEVLVAEVDGEVVGFTQVLIFQHFQNRGGWCCELESVHVRSDQRSHGIGAKLLESAVVFARARDCYRIQLTSRNVREDAHRFYLANGFEQTSQGFKRQF